MTKMPAMIFAAGRGTRMGTITQTLPKPLVRVNGRTLISYAEEYLRGAGVERIVANVHHLPELLIPHLEEAGITPSLETDRLLDTGGGLKAARPLLNSDAVITSNSDAIFRGPNPVSALLNEWHEDIGALLLVVPQARAVGREGGGDFDLRDGRLTRGGPFVYTGVQVIKTEAVAQIDETVFSLNRVWDRLMAEGEISAVIYDGKWCDVGHPAGITAAEELLRHV